MGVCVRPRGQRRMEFWEYEVVLRGEGVGGLRCVSTSACRALPDWEGFEKSSAQAVWLCAHPHLKMQVERGCSSTG